MGWHCGTLGSSQELTRKLTGQLSAGWPPMGLWEGFVPRTVEIQIQKDLPRRRGMQGYLEPSSLW